MALNRAEKAAGRTFRAEQTEKLLAETDRLVAEAHREGRTFFVVPPFLATYRHLCPHHMSPGRPDGISTSMKLGEAYVFSPAYVVAELEPEEPGGKTRMVTELPESGVVVANHKVPEGRFGFVYRKGKCVCGAAAQSRVGKLVDAHERPPLRGREAR